MYSYPTFGSDLYPDGGVLVQNILAADGEGGVAAHGAGPGDAGLQGGAVLQVNIATIILIITVVNDLIVTGHSELSIFSCDTSDLSLKVIMYVHG